MIKVLDCTLRDGGYINDWRFGKENIKKVIKRLEEANIDIIECGYLVDKKKNSIDSTLFNFISDTDIFLSEVSKKNYVCMINYGDYTIEKLPSAEESKISGIRLAFHKKDRNDAINYVKQLKEKGYKVYIQPMVSLSYTDSEFMDLIDKVNEIGVTAFYIVDSFGVMRQSDLLRLFYLTNHNLNSNIELGYHSHNNLQLAFSNAQAIVSIAGRRNLIIDSSIMGMGRGAGNLNTELFLEYMNENKDGDYKIFPILQAIDEVINKEYQLNCWGYSLPHYLSAQWKCHPNYSTFLEAKNTLTIVDINHILAKLSEEKRLSYDKNYIQYLYEEYQSHHIADTEALRQLEEQLHDKEVLLLAPGGSIVLEQKKIQKIISEKNLIVISINFISDLIKSDFVFYSNIRRYIDGKHDRNCKEIVTSNIEKQLKTIDYLVDYSNLLSDHSVIKDNAAMMLIKLLIQIKVKSVYLAGLDGYSSDVSVDYVDRDMALVTDVELLKTMNLEMSKRLRLFEKDIKIYFVTKQRRVILQEGEV